MSLSIVADIAHRIHVRFDGEAEGADMIVQILLGALALLDRKSVV